MGREKKRDLSLLKEKLTSGLVLVTPNLQKPVVVEGDARGDSIGAVLQQEGHAIAFESSKLKV